MARSVLGCAGWAAPRRDGLEGSSFRTRTEWVPEHYNTALFQFAHTGELHAHALYVRRWFRIESGRELRVLGRTRRPLSSNRLLWARADSLGRQLNFPPH